MPLYSLEPWRVQSGPAHPKIPGVYMKFTRIFGSLLPLALLFPVLCLAQGSAQTDDIAKLREQIAAQQKQLDQQRQALESAQKALESAQKSIDSQQKLLDRLVAAQP